MKDDDLVLRVAHSTGRRAGYKQLVRELGLGGGRERRLLREQLDRLTHAGKLVELDREFWTVPVLTRRQNNWISGRLDLHRDGYGFVRPNANTQNGANDREDIFIPPDSLEGAMQGDRVLVELLPACGDRRSAGRILRVLERGNLTVVGIFHYSRGGRSRTGERIPGNCVTPLNGRAGETILIPFGSEIPPTTETQDRVLGKEAKAQATEHDNLEGLIVDVEITDWPTATRPARGRVIEILGDRDAFGVDVEILIRKHHLPYVFPDRVLEEARAVAVVPRNDLWAAKRRDFRDLPIVTIDGETARDFDDAVFVRPLKDGSHELQVHIADASHYVLPGTALDLEARLRGNSVYFPDRAIPMLPMELSTNVCSLRPGEDRLVLSCLMRIGTHGEILDWEICEGVIRSARRMTYTQIHAILEGDALEREKLAGLVPEFERMYALARLMNARRERRGSIDFDLPEPVIQFDEHGRMRGIVRSERSWANRLIEEFMLAANECVAMWIESLGVPSIYRVHEKPDAKRVANFEEIAAHFGYSLGLGALPIRRLELRGDRRERMRRGGDKRVREIPEDIPVTPQMYQKLTERLAGKPEERILTYLMLRSLKQARYSEKNEGHFALATASYTHFTSPIRRYADLVVHRIVKALLAAGNSGHREMSREDKILLSRAKSSRRGDLDGAEEPAFSPRRSKISDVPPPQRSLPQIWDREIPAPIPEPELAAIAQEVSQTERRAADAERELIEWKKVRFMQDRIGEEFSGIVLNVTKFGLFVELDDLFIEGLVPLDSLQSDRYRFQENSRQIVGESTGHRISVGDSVRVILDRIDVMENKLQFALVEPPTHRGKNRSAKALAFSVVKHPNKQRSARQQKKKRRRR